MLKILNFFKSNAGNAQILTMRQRFDAAQDEMNAVLAELNEMPTVQFDAAAKSVTFTSPEQFPDEALALPAPEKSDEDILEPVAVLKVSSGPNGDEGVQSKPD